MNTSYFAAGIDVHKSMLAVVITDAAREGEFQFQKRKLGATASQLRDLRQWLTEHQVRVAVPPEAVPEERGERKAWCERLVGLAEIWARQCFHERHAEITEI